MKKKVLSVLLTLALLLPTVLTAFAAGFSDVASNMWAYKAIDYMTGKKIVNGYPDGTFKPDNEVTRAEFVKMLDETFGLTELGTISYSDASSGAWYYDYFRKAQKQGYLLSYGAKLEPDVKLTREEAASLLVRYLALPQNEKKAASTFSDYSSISSGYRDYVLQAAYAGIINGYPDGTFGPKKTLTRAEALTILSRAAGSIYAASATGLDAGADQTSGNAVITAKGVTIKNATFNGNVIISEGILSGDVTLENCVIKGKLIHRGNCSLIVSGGSVNSCEAQSSSSAGKIIVNNKAVVSSMTLAKKATVSSESGAEITSLTVNAADSRLTGSGKLVNVTVNADGFESDAVPENSPIITGERTARFGGKIYPLANDNGFSVAPALVVSGSQEYLQGTSSVTGTLYYYYTDSSAVPGPANFTQTYEGALIKGSIPVSAGNKINNTMSKTDTVSIYRYLAVMIKTASKDLTPVLIARNTATSSGFTADPKVVSTATNDKMTGTPDRDGTLFYYYTGSTVQLNPTDFVNAYNSSESSVKGAFTVKKGIAISEDLKPSSSVSVFPYVAAAIYNAESKSYSTPVIIVRNGSILTAGAFTEGPFWTAGTGSVDLLSGVAASSGKVFYFYTNTSTAPSETEFSAKYAGTVTAMRGYFDVTAGSSFSSPLKSTAAGSPYIYLCIAFSPDSINYSAPMVLTRSSNTAASTGFSVEPVTVMSNNTDTLTFTPAVGGTVYVFYTNLSLTMDSATFKTIYDSDTTPAAVKFSFKATAGKASGTLNLGNTVNPDSLPNIAVMLVGDNGTSYLPVLLSRTNLRAGTGFSAVPSIQKTAGQGDKLTATASVKGTAHYYYTNSASLPNALFYKTFWANANANARGSIAFKKGESVNGFGIGLAEVVSSYAYVVFMMEDDEGGLYTPVLVARGASGVSGTGFAAAPVFSTNGTSDALTFTLSSIGTVYYYYANEAVSSSSAFMTNYNSAALKGTLSVTSLTSVTRTLKTSAQSAGYNQIGLMLKDANNVEYTPVFIGKQANEGNGFSAGPAVSAVGTSDVIAFTPSVTGTVRYYFTSSSAKPATKAAFDTAYAAASVKGQKAVTAGVADSFTVASSSVTTYSHIVLMVEKTGGIPFETVQIAHTVTVSGNGFSSAPSLSVKTAEGKKYLSLSFTPSVSGTVLVYFTNSGTTPAPEAAKAAFDNSTDRVQFPTQAIIRVERLPKQSANFDFIVVMMTQGDGKLFTPVLLTVPESWSIDLP